MSLLATAATTSAARIVFAYDGAVLGATLAALAVDIFTDSFKTSSSLRHLTRIPSLQISDLRPDGRHDGILAAVRGHVIPSSSLSWTSIRTKHGGALVGNHSDQRAVIVKTIQKDVRISWFGVYNRLSSYSYFDDSSKLRGRSSVRSVPFVLYEGGSWSNARYVHVGLGNMSQALPLVKVYDRWQLFRPATQSLWEAAKGNFCTVGRKEVVKILPVGKEVTAVGICRGIGGGALEIEPCAALPFFLSGMTKEEMEVDLALEAQIRFWLAVVLGAFSAGLLLYALSRNWRRLWEWWQGRGQNEGPVAAVDDAQSSSSDEEEEDVPEEQACAVCLTRRKRMVFFPCGHLVCCRRCAVRIRQGSSPNCPVCRERIEIFVRVFDS